MKKSVIFRSAVCALTAAAVSSSATLATCAFAEGSDAADSGYQGRLTLIPGDTLSNKLDIDLKNTDINFAYNENGAVKAGIDYDSQSLMNIEANFDAESGRLYFKIPELSDEVLYIDLSDLSDEDVTDVFGASADVNLSYGDISDITDIAENFDVDSLDLISAFESFAPYVSAAVNVLDDGESGTAEGTLPGGVAYSYDTMTYKLNRLQLRAAETAFAAAASDNEILIAAAEFLGYEGDDAVAEMIDDFIWENADDEADEFEVSLYYDGSDGSDSDAFRGIEIDFSDSSDINFIVGEADGTTAFTVNGESREAGLYFFGTLDGYYSIGEDGGISGKIDYTSGANDEDDSDENYSVYTTLSVNDLVIGDTAAKGGIEYISGDTYGENNDIAVSFDFGETAQSLYATLSFGGELYLTVDYSGSAADFDGVTLDTANAYNLLDEDKLAAYLENANVDEFEAHAKAVLGDALYELIFGEDDSESDPAPSESTDGNSSDVSASSSSGGTSGGTSAKSSDSSPETGAAAGVAAATILLFAAAGITVSKKK
jgi:hypothetical protein